MNNQSNDKNKQALFNKIYTDLFASRLAKALFFIGSLVIALVISFFRMRVGDLFNYDGSIIVFLMIFPVGSLVVISEWLLPRLGGLIPFDGLVVLIFSEIILWFIYIVIMIIGIRGRSLITSKITFFVFEFLLLLNMGSWFFYK